MLSIVEKIDCYDISNIVWNKVVSLKVSLFALRLLYKGQFKSAWNYSI